MEFFLGNIRGPQGLPGDGAGTPTYKYHINSGDWKVSMIFDDHGDMFGGKYFVRITLEQLGVPSNLYSNKGYVYGLNQNQYSICNYSFCENGDIIIESDNMQNLDILVMLPPISNIPKDDSINAVGKPIFGVTSLGGLIQKENYHIETKDPKRIKESKKFKIHSFGFSSYNDKYNPGTFYSLDFPWLSFNEAIDEQTIENSNFGTEEWWKSRGDYPWNSITKVNQDGIDFIKIPKFYHKISHSFNGEMQIELSEEPHGSGWVTAFWNGTSEIDYVLISAGNIIENWSSSKPKFEMGYGIGSDFSSGNFNKITSLREFAKTKGTGYHLFDAWDYEIIKILYIVEFADLNKQFLPTFPNQNDWGFINITQEYLNSSLNNQNNTKCSGYSFLPVKAGRSVIPCIANSFHGISNLYGPCPLFIDGIYYKQEKSKDGYWERNLYVGDSTTPEETWTKITKLEKNHNVTPLKTFYSYNEITNTDDKTNPLSGLSFPIPDNSGGEFDNIGATFSILDFDQRENRIMYMGCGYDITDVYADSYNIEITLKSSFFNVKLMDDDSSDGCSDFTTKLCYKPLPNIK